MKCPICGSKLVGKQICRYCKITDTQILNASNKKVKEYKKSGNTDMIHFTNVIPNDVSKLKLILFTIFFGFIGVNHYYVNRPIRGTFSLVSFCGSFGILIYGIAAGKMSSAVGSIYNLLYQILFIMMAINVIMWFGDILACVFKTFKVPIVLGDKE